MAAIANIVINDALATPVAHTFAFGSIENDKSLGTVMFEDRANGVYIGYNKLTLSVRRPTGDARSGNRNLRLMVKIETPKLEVLGNASTGVTPPPTVSYRPVAEVSITMPERSSLQDRKDLRAFIVAAMANTFVVDMFEKFELPY